MNFTHLHVHSEYSLLDGLIKIPDLVRKVKEFNMSAVAMTDHGAMYGAFQFYLACKDAGIKPIIGVEAYKARKSRFDRPKGVGKDHSHLTILAKDYEGYKNLIKIVTSSHLEGFYYKPRIDFELLKNHSKGLIILSGCLNSELSKLILEDQKTEAEKLLKQYKEIFGSNYYLEIQRIRGIEETKKVNEGLVSYSRKYNIPLVATSDVHYIDKEDSYAQEILLCIQTQHTIHEKNRPLSMYNTPEFYLKSKEEMMGLFVDLPEAIENTQKIVDMCNIEIPYGKWVLPLYPLPKNTTPEKFLRNLTYKMAERKFPITKIIRKRLDYELEIISNRGYATYFLIVQDFVNWAKKQSIVVGPGRGSAAGSLVAFCLGITDIDPLVYNLPFERFLNPDRPSPPDFDIDFADTRRDEVLDYVIDKYGKEKVAQIVTFGRMEARLAVRDVARALGYSYSQGDRIAKMIPIGKQGFSMSIDLALEQSPQLKFAYQSEEDVKKLLDIARKVEGIARHTSVHAAGVIIADKDLTEYVPLQRESKGKRIITQFDMYSLDLNAVSGNKALGLLKADFLGLRNLTIIENSIRFVKENTGKQIDIQKILLNDKKTYNLISKGKTIGIFQLESRGMRRLAQDLKPTKMSDLSAMVALYRPGPMELIPTFLEGKRNPRSIKYLHKNLKPILSETYGILVYQEQVMEIAHKMAKYTMTEADVLRLAVGKKKKALMEKEKKKFIERFVANNYTRAVAEKIFSFIEKFAAYGFNKPHSASYGLIAYWTAYMKANYPVEYMTALLSAELQGSAGTVKEAKIFQAIDDCRNSKIEVLPPNINKSEFDFSIEDGSIRFGLSAVKNVGKAAIESILIVRKKEDFVGLKDFLSRVDLRRVNKKTVESLIKAGAFDKFGERSALLIYYPEVHAEILKEKKHEIRGQYGLFADKNKDKIKRDLLPEVEELSESEFIAMEKEVIGFSISVNPLASYKRYINKKITKKIGELDEEDIGKKHIIAGSISQIKKVTTRKNNKQMAFVTIYDETGMVEAVVFPKLYDRTRSIWISNNIIIVRGKVDKKEQNINFIIDDAVELSKLNL